MEMSEKAIQSYDITYMLGMGLNSGISKSHELYRLHEKIQRAIREYQEF